MLIVDTHCDTLYMRALTPEQTPCVTLDTLTRGGVSLQVCALFNGPYGEKSDSVAEGDAMLTVWDELTGAQGWRAVDSPFDAVEGQPSVMLSIEAGEIFAGDLARVRMFRERGVRMVGLTWNHENDLGSPAKHATDQGIKPFGWEVLGEMARLKMAADTSHLNARGFWDLIERHSQPPMASHSCCAALHPHFRNLTDDQIRALIDRGGWMGINFYPQFLTGDTASIADIVRHIDHVVSLGGAAHVGFGSDYDGIEVAPIDAPDPSAFGGIVAALRDKGYDEATVRGIAGENFLAYFKRLE